MNQAVENINENSIDQKAVNPDFDFSKIGLEEITNEVKKLTKPDQSDEITGEDLMRMNIHEKPECLWEPFFPYAGNVTLAGGSDLGKSTVARQFGIAIVTGANEFLGFALKAKHNSVIFVSTEDQPNETAYLLNRQCEGIDPSKLSGLRFIFENENLISKIDRSLTNKPADAIIIDCFADTYGNDLKDSTRVRQFLHSYQELSHKHQTLILWLHHSAKRTENLEPSKNNLLSGQGLESKMRLVFELRADLMNPTHRHLCCVKGNYLPSHLKKESFVLAFDEQRFHFSNTGERMPYELLVRQPDADNSKAKYLVAQSLKDAGLSMEKIREKMGYGSKGTVWKLFDKAKKQGWTEDVSRPFPNGNDGNDEDKPF